MKFSSLQFLAKSVILFSVSIAWLGCAEEPPIAGEDRTNTRIYTNAEFGFSLEYPADWHVVSPDKYAGFSAESRRDLLEKKVIPDDAQYRDIVAISKYPYPWPFPRPTPGAAVLAAAVEVLPASPSAVGDGRVYLANVKKLYEKTDWQVHFDGEPYEHPINGVEFYRLDHTRTVQDKVVRQSSLATVTGQHVLCVILTALSESEMGELETVLSTLRFAENTADKPVPSGPR